MVAGKCKMNAKDVVRLKRSLEYGLAPISQYNHLRYETISDADLSELLREITLRRDGVEVAIDILHMKLHWYSKEDVLSHDIQHLGRELVLKYLF